MKKLKTSLPALAIVFGIVASVATQSFSQTYVLADRDGYLPTFNPPTCTFVKKCSDINTNPICTNSSGLVLRGLSSPTTCDVEIYEP